MIPSCESRFSVHLVSAVMMKVSFGYYSSAKLCLLRLLFKEAERVGGFVSTDPQVHHDG